MLLIGRGCQRQLLLDVHVSSNIVEVSPVDLHTVTVCEEGHGWRARRGGTSGLLWAASWKLLMDMAVQAVQALVWCLHEIGELEGKSLAVTPDFPLVKDGLLR
jgi:hypothetical protein